MAETAGDATPYGFQYLLERAVWSANQARDELYAYVAEHLGDAEGGVIDETGFPKGDYKEDLTGRGACRRSGIGCVACSCGCRPWPG